MGVYKAPLRDVRFCLDELFDFPAHYRALGADLDGDDMQMIVDEVAKFAERVLAPLNQSGDLEGPHWHDGAVTAPAGFRDAYRQYVDAGWPRLGNPARYGGTDLPYSLKLVVSEFMQTANQGWCMYALLNDGAIRTLLDNADQTLLDAYLPALVSGEWTGTMCLTEPQCGSDLNLVRSRAEPAADGAYRITGSKIFISSGEQDLTDNIVHLVLARLPEAPAGTKGISLFLVPKVLPDGSANAIRCLSLEHKMGLKASATCTMAFDGAQGWLVGAPHRGLNAMFVFINKSRLGAAQQGQAQAEAAYQIALAYARERVAGRAPNSTTEAADPLFAHADIRRMLLTQKAMAEGGRMLLHYCAQWVDRADSGDAAIRGDVQQRLALLIPIAKGLLTEWSSEATDLGLQVLGGHGYMREWEIEQRIRDARITRIYEGTTGIQGMDLLGRKVLGAQRDTFEALIAEILDFCENAPEGDALRPVLTSLAHATVHWHDITDHIDERAVDDPHLVGAVAVDYLLLAGVVTVGYLWARAACLALENLRRPDADTAFYRAKVDTARFYFAKLMPRTHLYLETIRSGSETLMGAALPQ